MLQERIHRLMRFLFSQTRFRASLQPLRQMGEQDSSDRTEESRTRTTENQIGSLL